jgi:hypothetical protein
MRKVDYLFFLENHIKGDRCTLLNAWGSMILDRHLLHQNWTMASSHAACA